jgi:hypothetical protein
MYVDALSFLEDERETWRAFEALDGLTDEQLAVPVAAANGWSGRDLMGHLVAWQEVSLQAAKELAVGERSPTIEHYDREWPLHGDEINEQFIEAWRALPMDEVRARFRSVAGELRGFLTVVPESRWIKHAAHQESFVGETLEHYEEHRPDLEAILAAAAES